MGGGIALTLSRHQSDGQEKLVVGIENGEWDAELKESVALSIALPGHLFTPSLKPVIAPWVQRHTSNSQLGILDNQRPIK